MRVAIVGSRSFTDFDLAPYIPDGLTEIVSGGAIGVDTIARNYAVKHGIKCREFLPDYERYGKCAPLLRNIDIINYSDRVIVFWDGISNGSKHVIVNCKKLNKPFEIYMPKKN